MSLKQDSNLSKEEIWNKRYAHLIRTMKESGYEEIKEYVYRQLNKGRKNQPKDYLLTARIGFKFFKINSQQDCNGGKPFPLMWAVREILCKGKYRQPLKPVPMAYRRLRSEAIIKLGVIWKPLEMLG